MATILVVDDESGTRDLLCEILGDEGHTVFAAGTRTEALALWGRYAPDLVLLDVLLPDGDGIELLRMRRVSAESLPPVIMLSAFATIDAAVDATRIGAFDFLEKPIPLAKLLSTVKRGLLSNGQGKNRVLQQKAEDPAEHVNQQAVQSVGEQIARAANGWIQLPYREAREAFEKLYFSHHLKTEHGNVTRLAEKCGLERTHLYRKLRQLGLKVAPQFEPTSCAADPIGGEPS